MHTAPFDYQKPTSVDQALNMLSAEGAAALAGGQSLLPAMKLRLANPSTLVELSGLADLRGIDGGRIGAMVTHADIAAAGLGVLSEAASLIGDRQVRNRGTIGGSIAHADPAADYPTVLVGIDAQIQVAGGTSRSIAAGDFFLGLFQTALEPGELITAIEVDTAKLDSAVYEKHKHPASGYAVVGVCATAGHMVVGGVTGAPVLVAGNNPDDIPAAITDPIGDVYASGEYRVHLATILAKRALSRLGS